MLAIGKRVRVSPRTDRLYAFGNTEAASKFGLPPFCFEL